MNRAAGAGISAAHERRSAARLHSKAPKSDYTIERWGSIIHWRELAVVRAVGKSRGYFRWVVPVTCGSCNKRRRANVYDTNPTTGQLTTDSLRSSQYDYTLGFTGLCKSCLKRINKPNTTYHDGTELLHTERTKDGLPVTCGSCKRRGFLKCALSETLHDKHWPCPSCGHILGKWLHEESGATVYWLKRKEGKRNYVEFDCAKCGGTFYCKDELPERAEWWGLCPEDRFKHNPQRITDNKPLPGSDKAIDYNRRFGEGKPSRGKKRPRQGMYVSVPCPLPGCGRENVFHFETTRKEGFTGLCKPGKNGHTRDEIALFFLSQAQNGNGQDSRDAKKRGHKSGDLFLDRDKLKEDFVDVVKHLRKGLLQHKITRREIAREYNRRGEDIHESTVTTRVHMMYGDDVDVADAVALALEIKV